MDLRKRLCILAMSITVGTYRHVALTRKLVKVGLVGPTLVLKTTVFVSVVEDVEVVVINIVSRKDIGNEFQEGGLSDTSLSN